MRRRAPRNKVQMSSMSLFNSVQKEPQQGEVEGQVRLAPDRRDVRHETYDMLAMESMNTRTQDFRCARRTLVVAIAAFRCTGQLVGAAHAIRGIEWTNKCHQGALLRTINFPCS